MMIRTFLLAALVASPALHIVLAQNSTPPQATAQEKHLRNVRQLTFGGQNAEAYFSADGKKLIYQSSHGDVKCDQIFEMNIDGTGQHMVSTGKGRTTCSYFFPNGKKILYASTHLGSPECPPRPDFSKGYVWAVYSGYDIFTANPDGSNLKQLTIAQGYDAEATISLDGKKITFTSLRNGDLDIYTMDADGKNVKQLTHEAGYDGGRPSRPMASGSCTEPTIRKLNKRSRTTRTCWRRT
jgi:TolB protein